MNLSGIEKHLESIPKGLLDLAEESPEAADGEKQEYPYSLRVSRDPLGFLIVGNQLKQYFPAGDLRFQFIVAKEALTTWSGSQNVYAKNGKESAICVLLAHAPERSFLCTAILRGAHVRIARNYANKIAEVRRHLEKNDLLQFADACYLLFSESVELEKKTSANGVYAKVSKTTIHPEKTADIEKAVGFLKSLPYTIEEAYENVDSYLKRG